MSGGGKNLLLILVPVKQRNVLLEQFCSFIHSFKLVYEKKIHWAACLPFLHDIKVLYSHYLDQHLLSDSHIPDVVDEKNNSQVVHMI